MTTTLNCPNCGKLLGNWLLGEYGTECPRCHSALHFRSSRGGSVSVAVESGERPEPDKLHLALDKSMRTALHS